MTITSLSAARKDRERKQYAALVLKTFDEFEHADKREQLDRKAAVQIAARERI